MTIKTRQGKFEFPDLCYCAGVCNEEVTIKTRQGKFEFPNQRFADRAGE